MVEPCFGGCSGSVQAMVEVHVHVPEVPRLRRSTYMSPNNEAK